MSRQYYQSNSTGSSSNNSMKNMPVNDYKPSNNGASNSSSTSNYIPRTWTAYENAVMDAAVNIVNTTEQETQSRRPRSPIQRILRYRLDDPVLTSVKDTRFRPYREGRKNQKSYLNNPNRQQQEMKNPLDGPRFGTGEDLENWEENPIKPVKEREFTNRCMELGVRFQWYKLKDTVNGENLENIAIEMEYDKTVFKVYGGFHQPRRAREMAFLEGISRLEFLFGRIGEPDGGFWKNHGGPNTENSPFEIRPNPINELPGWTCFPQAPPQPPPLPRFAPPSKPPLPTCPPPPSHERSLFEPRMELFPPGTNNSSWEEPGCFGYGPQSHVEPVVPVRSSWTEMSTNTGFYNEKDHTNYPKSVNQVILQPKMDSLIANKRNEFQLPLGIGTTGIVKKASGSAALYEANPGPNENTFLKKLKELGLFYRCDELDTQIRNCVHYFGFKIEIWKWDKPTVLEKALGDFSPFVGVARESAFSVALQNIKNTFESSREDDAGGNNDFCPNNWGPSPHTMDNADFDRLPKRLGRGRGSMTINDEQDGITNHRIR